MNVVHYTLGFPPHRTGGLTRYAIDLAQAQRTLGHNVTIIYPSNFSFLSKHSTIKQEREGVYRLINGLPVPLLYGTKKTRPFISERDISGFEKFFDKVKPEVLHIHTLMGLPKCLIELMRAKGVKIVYTTHDYYGLCPRVNFIDINGKPCPGPGEEKCSECCHRSPGRLFLKVRNSRFIVPLKRLK